MGSMSGSDVEEGAWSRECEDGVNQLVTCQEETRQNLFRIL